MPPSASSCSEVRVHIHGFQRDARSNGARMRHEFRHEAQLAQVVHRDPERPVGTHRIKDARRLQSFADLVQCVLNPG